MDGPLWLEGIEEAAVEERVVIFRHDNVGIDRVEYIGEIIGELGAISVAVEPEYVRPFHVVVVLGVVILFIIEFGVWVIIVLLDSIGDSISINVP